MNRRCVHAVGFQIKKIAVAIAVVLLISGPALADPIFTVGNLVVSVEGDGSGTGTYTDNQAAPLTLYQYDPTSGTSGPATLINTLELPQTTVTGGNYAVSGEYGSSSEGTLQLSGNGEYLTIAGYGINANTFNTSPGSYSPDSTNTALGQSGSMTNQSAYTPVARVVALIDANGNVSSSTAVYNVFNANNPRSAYTANGSTVYISGQGTTSPTLDSTGGVFLVNAGSTTTNPTSITGSDAGTNMSQDTREVQIYNGQLYTSTDSKEGTGFNRDFIATLGTGTPTTATTGPTMLPGYGNSGGTGKVTITANTANGVNSIGQQINLSPENYFFANSTTLYVADSGDPKNNSATTGLGDGGLQKWTLNTTTGIWSLDYTLSAGLDLVPNTQADNPTGDDTTGLYGLTGEVINGEVELFATNFTIGDLDPTFLYGITDSLTATTLPTSESFTEIAAAPADSDFKGVSFAPTPVPTPEPTSLTLVGLGMAALLLARRRRKAA